jgi:hypothetical protein
MIVTQVPTDSKSSGSLSFTRREAMSHFRVSSTADLASMFIHYVHDILLILSRLGLVRSKLTTSSTQLTLAAIVLSRGLTESTESVSFICGFAPLDSI